MTTDQVERAEYVPSETDSARPYPPQECGAEHWANYILRGEDIWELWTCTRDAGHGPRTGVIHEEERNGEIGQRRWTE